MADWPNLALPLLLVAALLAFKDWLSTPSCSGGPPAVHGSGDLRVMMVADLMLLGSDASFTDHYFRDHIMSKFFANSIQTLKPDMIVVLGDISAKGSEITERKWISIIEQFEGILGRYSSLPLHIVLGDKDVGTCVDLNSNFVHIRAKHLPGLDPNGCGSFDISNVSFLSLNAVALLCGDNALRFSIEKVMERENHHFQRARVNEAECHPLGCERRESFADISWRQNSMESGSGPVVLLHFPLHKFEEVAGVPTFPEAIVSDHLSVASSSKLSGANGRRLYDRLHTLPANSTQYILQALKPRIIFNAHAGTFSVFVHADGTREVTVPAMTWKTREVPGFIIATFDTKGLLLLGPNELPSSILKLADKLWRLAGVWRVAFGCISGAKDEALLLARSTKPALQLFCLLTSDSVEAVVELVVLSGYSCSLQFSDVVFQSNSSLQ